MNPGNKNRAGKIGRVTPTGGETKAEWKERSERDEIGRKKTGREEKDEKAV